MQRKILRARPDEAALTADIIALPVSMVATAGIARLLDLVEKGVLDADDASLRERLVNLCFRRDELAKEVSDLQKRLASAEPVITPEKVNKLAVLLREKLLRGSAGPAPSLCPAALVRGERGRPGDPDQWLEGHPGTDSCRGAG
jgi:uncharacterized protein YlxW (UPF0749 family)